MLETAITLGVLIALVVYSVRNSGKRPADQGNTTYTDTTGSGFPIGHPLAHGSNHTHHDSRDDARDCGPVVDTSPSFDSCGTGDSGGSND